MACSKVPMSSARGFPVCKRRNLLLQRQRTCRVPVPMSLPTLACLLIQGSTLADIASRAGISASVQFLLWIKKPWQEKFLHN